MSNYRLAEPLDEPGQDQDQDLCFRVDLEEETQAEEVEGEVDHTCLLLLGTT